MVWFKKIRIVNIGLSAPKNKMNSFSVEREDCSCTRMYDYSFVLSSLMIPLLESPSRYHDTVLLVLCTDYTNWKRNREAIYPFVCKPIISEIKPTWRISIKFGIGGGQLQTLTVEFCTFFKNAHLTKINCTWHKIKTNLLLCSRIFVLNEFKCLFNEIQGNAFLTPCSGRISFATKGINFQ
jgi:hypothetical protein